MSQRSAALTARAVATTTLTAAALLLGATVATAGGSDAPPPYQVTSTGLVLPEGMTFMRHGHVNVRWTSSTNEGSSTMHLGGPGTAWHDVEGTSSVTWERLGLPADACIVWVQIHGFNEHFGEGGQRPICRTTPNSEPPVVDEAPDETPDTPAPEVPAPPQDTPQDTPQPPQEPVTPTPPATDTPEPVDVDEPIDEAVPPLTPAAAPPPPGGTITAAPAPEETAPLAATGASSIPLALVAALATALGAALLLARRTFGGLHGDSRNDSHRGCDAADVAVT